MENMPSVFVVVLNYNGKDCLNTCLGSIFQSDYSNFQVIIVDNDSRDESFEMAKKQFSRAHFIKSFENLGFAKGNNLGIRYALEKFADYVFVLNNDTTIERDTISKLVNSAESNKDFGIVSPLILSKDKEIWFAGGKINWLKMKTEHVLQFDSKNPYESEYICGCAMFVKKEVFKKTGLFDERYFLYYEDADFSIRAKRAGFKLMINPASEIIHFEKSSSSGSKIYWLVLSALLFFKNNSSFFVKIWLFFYLMGRKTKNFYKAIILKDALALKIRKAYVDYRKI